METRVAETVGVNAAPAEGQPETTQTQDPSTQPLLLEERQSPQSRQKILVLVGLIGSGKSTFAQALASLPSSTSSSSSSSSSSTAYVRVCQDVLGSRQAVESAAVKYLKQGKSVIVDRTNVDASQRAHWLQLGYKYQEEVNSNRADQSDRFIVQVDAIYFATPLAECERRVTNRTEHETIHSPEQARYVLHTFARQLVPPTAEEGFHKILTVSPEEMQSLPPGAEEVQRLLQRLEALPSSLSGGTQGAKIDITSRSASANRGRGRGYGSGQHRGRGVGWGALDRGRARGTGSGRGHRGGYNANFSATPLPRGGGHRPSVPVSMPVPPAVTINAQQGSAAHPHPQPQPQPQIQMQIQIQTQSQPNVPPDLSSSSVASSTAPR